MKWLLKPTWKALSKNRTVWKIQYDWYYDGIWLHNQVSFMSQESQLGLDTDREKGIINFHIYKYFDVIPHHSKKHEVNKLYTDTYSKRSAWGGKHMIRHFRAECPRFERERGGIQVCCVSSVQISIKENTAEACEETGIAKQ